ncbi:MAG: ATP-binding protein [Chloroflexi bacterium]|nr:ATP-binding protein [Chloroflexota bacterium]
MFYRDLVQFEPIETVIQIRGADQHTTAHHLVETYVISNRMADQLIHVVIPQLQFLRPRDNKGVLIVGNYGTGKTHLMSVISAVAEYADLADRLNHAEVKAAAADIAGQFKVIRVEIGGVTRSLRDTLLEELEIALEQWGVPFTFPAADQVTNNKDGIIQAIAAFQERYPDKGILLVVDELLDFLRTREERKLILDLGFLRELGEVAALTSFRFMGGLQETLFDSPRFAFVADQLRRVRDRFEQVRIAREDIAFVVAHRLLRKSPAQLARVTDHLRQFTPLYHRLAERLGEFAQLFPIHPAYIETFERVYIAEKREVLKTFSQAMRLLLDREVPANEPGLISYDHYWDILRDNPSLRSMAGVAEVIEKSNVLQGRVRNAYTRAYLRPMALRIIHGLSVHRLTTSDINVPLGTTAEELRDDLCLYTPMPENTADFLLDQVQVALREIMRTVSGQYISLNEANGQYYLDIKKDIDFDAKIAERGAMMEEESDLNRYFFDALRQVFALSDSTYVTGHRIWFYELPWAEHRVTRPGYLFFGAPDERSTAQPPRDFYLYILPPFLRRDWRDEERTDEVIFRLTGLDQAFVEILRQYAGARAMAAEAATHRDVYAAKAEEHSRRLVRWLGEHFASHLQITYQGASEPIGSGLARTRSSASQSLEELIRLLAAHLLTPEFEERYPQYPAFPRLSQPISEDGRGPSAMDGIRFLTGRGRTNLAVAVLEGLKLVDGEGIVRPYVSPYARHFLELLQNKPENQVVNRGEVIETVAGGLQPIEKDITFHLEPEWVAVVLVSLVYNGDIVLNPNGRETLDAGNMERAATLAITDLADFRFYSRPRALPLNIWAMIFEGLGLQPGLIRDENTREEAVRRLQARVQQELERTVNLQGRLQQGLQLWNTPVFTDRYTIEVQSGMVISTDLPDVTFLTVDLLPDLRNYKTYLEGLARYNTPGKLRNLYLTLAQAIEANSQRQGVERAAKLLDTVQQLQLLAAYLAEAQANLLPEHPWSQRAVLLRRELLDQVRRLGKGEETAPPAEILRRMEALKADYITTYSDLHRRLVLGPQADDLRQRLKTDPRLAALNMLAGIDLLSAAELVGWKQALDNLRPCRDFYEGAIADTPTCPACQLRPAAQSSTLVAEQVLHQMDHRLDVILARWRQALHTNLNSEAAQLSLAAMTPAERRPIEQFLAQSDDDTHIPAGFVTAAGQALHGIRAVTLHKEELLDALKAGGLPCTKEELQRRFQRFVEQTMHGCDVRNTRLTLDE